MSQVMYFFLLTREFTTSWLILSLERIPVTKPPKLRGDLRADTGDLKLATYYCSPTQ